MSQKILSASRIKTFESCSWKYHCNYVLKIPSESNDGARRGNVCHAVLEYLLGKNRIEYVNRITEAGNIEAVESVARLVKKLLVKEGADVKENYKTCNKFIVTGLNQDFFGEGGIAQEPEIEFLIKGKNPEYQIRGYIDKAIRYDKENTLKIVDYKSSKVKFKGQELTANIQAMTYSLAAKKLWPELKKVLVEFVFLKYPRKPLQQIQFSKEQLDGFEYMLSSVYEKMNAFTEEDAHSNYASDKPEPKDGSFGGCLECGRGSRYKGQLKKDGTLVWHCSYKYDFEYYALVDKNGKVLKSDLKESNLEPKKGCKIIKKYYAGCPAHNAFQNKQADAFESFKSEESARDDFDF